MEAKMTIETSVDSVFLSHPGQMWRCIYNPVTVPQYHVVQSTITPVGDDINGVPPTNDRWTRYALLFAQKTAQIHSNKQSDRI
jgi:hypothetical protein